MLARCNLVPTERVDRQVVERRMPPLQVGFHLMLDIDGLLQIGPSALTELQGTVGAAPASRVACAFDPF
jgi:hypothetical protein